MAYCRVCKGEHRKHARRGVASGGSMSRSSRRTGGGRLHAGRLRVSGGSFTVYHENGMERTFPANSTGMSAARKWQASLPPGETWVE